MLADVVVCFKVFDCDRDGILSIDELVHMLAAMLVVHQLNQSTPAHRPVSLQSSLSLSLFH